MFRWAIYLICLLGVALAPGGRPGAAESDGARVAVIMSADVDAYRDALKGFKETAAYRIVAEYDMEGNFDRGEEIADEIQSEIKPDLIFAVGVWALQVVAGQQTDSPVVYAMVLNPPSVAGAVADNITGASMNVSVEQTVRLLKQLEPQIRRVGVIFSRAKTGYLVARAKKVAEIESLEFVAKEIHSSKEAIGALKMLQREGVDVIWILPDATVLNPKVIEYALLFSYRNRIPLLGLSERQARMGAMLSVSFASSRDIGRQAGELANVVLAGTSISEIPYTTARQTTLTVNLKAARKLGVQIPDSILARADTIIR